MSENNDHVEKVLYIASLCDMSEALRRGVDWEGVASDLRAAAGVLQTLATVTYERDAYRREVERLTGTAHEP